MSTDMGFVQYVCEQIEGCGTVSSRKMFGEYMIYVNAKPLLLVCDNTVYVKMLDCLGEALSGAKTGNPYKGAKLHYILDPDDRELCREVIRLIEPVTPFPKPKKRKRDPMTGGGNE